MPDTSSIQKKHNIFLDANILIATPYDNPFLERLKQLSEESAITILTTAHTISEVANCKIEKEYKHLKCLSSEGMIPKMNYYFDTTIPEMSRRTIKNIIKEKSLQSAEELLTSLNAEAIDIDVVVPSLVLTAYANSEGMFKDGKKDQFPDAFIFECLKARASGDTPIIIVSEDNDFHHPYCKDTANITCLKTIKQALTAIGMSKEDSELAGFIQSNTATMVKLVNDELSNYEIEIHDIDDGEVIGTSIENIKMSDVKNFGTDKSSGHLLVSCHIDARVNILYEHPDGDMAVWDSATEEWFLPADKALGEHEIELEAIEVSLLISVDEDGEPKEIVDLNFNSFDHLSIYIYD